MTAEPLFQSRTRIRTGLPDTTLIHAENWYVVLAAKVKLRVLAPF